MADTFNIKWDEAESYAKQILNTSESIRDVFETMTNIFNDFTGDAWDSFAAKEVLQMFNTEIKPNYSRYVEIVKNSANAVLKDVESYREGEANATQVMNG